MSKVLSFSQTVYDVIADSQRKQRSIGTLIKDTSTLTVNGTLSKINTADYFKFTVKETIDNVSMVIKASGTPERNGSSDSTISSVDVENDVGYANVQLLDRRGNVIADSSVNATLDQQKAYQSLRNGELELDSGSYTVKVTRAPGVLRSQKVLYAVELLAGEEKKAYSTEQLDATSADSSAVIVPGANAISIIDYSESDDSTYTPASTGTLFDYWT